MKESTVSELFDGFVGSGLQTDCEIKAQLTAFVLCVYVCVCVCMCWYCSKSVHRYDCRCSGVLAHRCILDGRSDRQS